jgi:anti-sigma B factor antagonist
MLDMAPGWEVAVERGPDWLFVKLNQPEAGLEEAPPLAEQLWSLLEQHFTYRLVLEMDPVAVLRSHLIGQLVLLHRWITDRGGVLRLCGLSMGNRRVLETCHLDGRFPAYGNRMDAVLCRFPCCGPRKPR